VGAVIKAPQLCARRSASRWPLRAVQEGENSFARAVRDYIEQYARKKVRDWEDRARMLGLRSTMEVIPGGLVQRWGDKPVSAIDGHDVHQLIVEVRDKGVPGLERRSDGPSESMARAMLACVSALFGWLVKHRRVESNPCATVHRPEAGAARERVLSGGEIKLFWQATAKLPTPFAACLKLLLLTGCRRDEIACLRWAELSDDAIQLPGNRTKNKRPHTVPLNGLAREILSSVPRIEGCPYVFSNGKVPISAWSKTKRLLDDAMGKCIPGWVIHDLRRTFVTGLAELGERPDVIELTVNHISGSRSGIAGVYNRSELLRERRNALERWSLHIQGLVSGEPSNVVALPKKRKK
jgi:integrase